MQRKYVALILDLKNVSMSIEQNNISDYLPTGLAILETSLIIKAIVTRKFTAPWKN